MKRLNFVVVTSLLIAGCFSKGNYMEVEILGEKVLSSYCVEENLYRTDFGKANICPENKKYDWSIEYQSSTNPKHILILYVKKRRIVEQHRLIE